MCLLVKNITKISCGANMHNCTICHADKHGKISYWLVWTKRKVLHLKISHHLRKPVINSLLSHEVGIILFLDSSSALSAWNMFLSNLFLILWVAKVPTWATVHVNKKLYDAVLGYELSLFMICIGLLELLLYCSICAVIQSLRHNINT